jgi:SAM-dependent methyltransferase
MRGYSASTYGDAFADVYDEWYPAGPDTAVVVEALRRLAGGGPVLELGCGTGRLCVPLADAGLAVVGLDASGAMLARLRRKPGADRLTLLEADMTDFEVAPPPGPERPGGPAAAGFRLVFVAFNTFFNVASEAGQLACMRAVARHLQPAGRFALECFVPADPPAPARDAIEVRAVEADRVVLRISRQDPAAQTVSGQHVELSETGGVRLRPWHLRYAPPAELDRLAGSAGLRLVSRWADWAGAPFEADSAQHVSVYGPARG